MNKLPSSTKREKTLIYPQYSHMFNRWMFSKEKYIANIIYLFNKPHSGCTEKLEAALTLCTLSKISRRHIQWNIFLIFKKKETGFDILCKFSPLGTIRMNCGILFSEKNKQNTLSLSSAE